MSNTNEPLRLTLPAELVEAARRYTKTIWSDGRDPSRLGALNAVAWIGEQIAGLVARHDARTRSKR